jgi:hypothetical protein
MPEDNDSVQEGENQLDITVERVHLEWQAISCSYNGSHGKIVVLHDVWGQALPGEMQVLGGGGAAWGMHAEGRLCQGGLVAAAVAISRSTQPSQWLTRSSSTACIWLGGCSSAGASCQPAARRSAPLGGA